MKNLKNLSALALGVMTASSAFALTDGPYDAFFPLVGFQQTDFSNFVNIPKFNVAGGTLQSISITLEGNILATQRAENLDPTAGATLTLKTDATVTLKRPDNSNVVVVLPVAQNVVGVALYDNTTDFAGTSGITIVNSPGTANGNSVLNSGADLALFSGAGSVALPITANASTSATGSGNLVASFTTTAMVHATVTYTYTNVPEPKVYGAIGAVACVGLLGYRRFRNSQASKA